MDVQFDYSPFQIVEKWFENFEDVIYLFLISDIYNLSFDRRCVTGKAKLLIQSESKINNWGN